METSSKNIATLNKEQIDTSVLLDYVSEGIVITDADTKILYANAATKMILGLDDKDIHKLKMIDLVHPDDRPKVKKFYEELKKNSTLITLRRMKRKDGKYLIIERNATMLGKDKTISILRDVTERHGFEQRKDTFISMASHELRNPVNSISLYSEMARTALRNKDYKKAEEALQKIDPEISRATNLISDMLDLSKIQSGKLEFRMAPFKLDEIVRDAAQQTIGYAKRKYHIDIRGKISKEVYGDRDRIHQVVSNLLTNAIKYSPNSDIIIITLHEGENISVSISDFGIGIKEENQKRIFDKFYQVPEASKYSTGMGIGLFLCREIVKKHGGELTVSSHYGEGSTFTFTLPFKKN